jgi:hypothetical protein
MRTGGWFLTYTGRQFWITDPHPDDVDIADIAHALSNVCRFGGHSRVFYSVAQHCVHVVQRLRELQVGVYGELHGLLHDASEAYASDIVRPLKREIRGYREIEARLMRVIYEGLGIEEPNDFDHEIVKTADNELLLAERRDLIRHRDIPWDIPAEPWAQHITPWAPAVAEDAFMREFLTLRPRVASTQ